MLKPLIMNCIYSSYLYLRPSSYLLYCVRAVYRTPWGSVTVLQYFSKSLSRSLELTAMSERKGAISSPFHVDRVRNKSENRAAGSTGRAEAGKYFKVVKSLPNNSDSR